MATIVCLRTSFEDIVRDAREKFDKGPVVLARGKLIFALTPGIGGAILEHFIKWHANRPKCRSI